MLVSEKFQHIGKLIRWDKPIGTLLLLWPTLTALIIAAHGKPHAITLFVFVAGVFLLRSAGCIVNDIVDIHFDRHVSRTQDRPLTSKKISIREALLTCIFLLVIAFFLVNLLNLYTLFLACVGLLLTVIYPFLKRVTHLPQLGLGLTFNWGIPMAFAAETNHIAFIAWILFLLSLLWTVSYDTMYAMVDKEDDLKIGIKSSAILFGEKDNFIVFLLQTAIIFLLVMLGLILKLNFWFFVGIFFCSVLFFYQLTLIKNRNPAFCFRAFLNNHWAWFIVFFFTLLSYSP